MFSSRASLIPKAKTHNRFNVTNNATSPRNLYRLSIIKLKNNRNGAMKIQYTRPQSMLYLLLITTLTMIGVNETTSCPSLGTTLHYFLETRISHDAQQYEAKAYKH